MPEGEVLELTHSSAAAWTPAKRRYACMRKEGLSCDVNTWARVGSSGCRILPPHARRLEKPMAGPTKV